jgi:hypothetical protein
MTAPSHAQEPALRRRDDAGLEAHALVPSVELARGRERIHPSRGQAPSGLRGVLAVVPDHVEQHRTGFLRRRDLAIVIALREDRSLSTPQPIEPPGHPDLQPLHAAGEGAAIDGLDDQMDVVGEHGEVHDAKSFFVRRADGRSDPLEFPRSPKPRQPRAQPQRDVQRPVPPHRAPPPMRHRPTPRPWLATGPRPRTTTPPIRVHEIDLHRATPRSRSPGRPRSRTTELLTLLRSLAHRSTNRSMVSITRRTSVQLIRAEIPRRIVALDHLVARVALTSTNRRSSATLRRMRSSRTLPQSIGRERLTVVVGADVVGGSGGPTDRGACK